MFDPHVIAGLATLIVLELVLGIDNLVFVAILAGKLPPTQRDRARVIGLTAAMGMRLAMLAGASYVIALKDPIFELLGRSFSWRDIMLLIGGVFLLYKATSEIHERLEGRTEQEDGERRVPSFAMTIVQIVVLDAIFSLDSIITAVGMVDQLWVMMTAVILSMAIMIAASKKLTAFVDRHPTVIILCLSFLLLIGCSLLAEGLGFHFPKEYLYAAIGFSLLIESLNQIGGHKRRKAMLLLPSRQRTASAILKLLGAPPAAASPNSEVEAKIDHPVEAGGLHPDEAGMIRGVISLSTLPVRSIMTLRPQVVFIKTDAPYEEIAEMMFESGRTRILLCEKDIDGMIGVIDVKDAVKLIHAGQPLDLRAIAKPAMFVQLSTKVTRLMEEMRRKDERFAVVVDEHGQIEGVVTTTDIFAVIAGDLADDEDDGLVHAADESEMVVTGMARLSDVEAHFGQAVERRSREYETVSGHVLEIAGRLPEQGDVYDDSGLRYEMTEIAGRRIERVRITRNAGDSQ
jgi:CBS domain containing-hemolysin-like protein